jgi:hypothetical protein
MQVWQRDVMGRVIGVLACVLLASGCRSSSARPPAGAPGPAGQILVTCGPHGTSFPAEGLHAATGEETKDNPLAAGLRAVIGLSGLGLPADGWRLLVQDESRAMFAADTPNGRVVPSLRPEGQRWVFAGSGGCGRLMTVPAAGLTPAI